MFAVDLHLNRQKMGDHPNRFRRGIIHVTNQLRRALYDILAGFRRVLKGRSERTAVLESHLILGSLSGTMIDLRGLYPANRVEISQMEIDFHKRSFSFWQASVLITSR